MQSSTVTPPTATTAADIHIAYLAAGYEPGRPATLSANDLRLDREVWAAAECPECGAEGMEFLPYRRGNAYAGLARCNTCGHGEEA